MSIYNIMLRLFKKKEEGGRLYLKAAELKFETSILKEVKLLPSNSR